MCFQNHHCCEAIPDTVSALEPAAAPRAPLSFTFPDERLHKDRDSIHSVHGSVPHGAQHRAWHTVYTQFMLAAKNQQIKREPGKLWLPGSCQSWGSTVRSDLCMHSTQPEPGLVSGRAKVS